MKRFGIVMALLAIALGAAAFWKSGPFGRGHHSVDGDGQTEAVPDPVGVVGVVEGQPTPPPELVEGSSSSLRQVGGILAEDPIGEFSAGGSVRVLSESASEAWDGITLVWQTEDGVQISSRVQAGQWSATFPLGTFHLDSAHSPSGGNLPLVREQAVSNNQRNADVLLAADDAIVLVIQDAATGLDLGGLKATPVMQPGMEAELARAMGQKPISKLERQSMLVEMGVWRISGDSPLILPSVPIAHSVTVACDGYSSLVVPSLDGPGVYRAQLEAKRGMEFHLQVDAGSRRKWELLLDGGGRPRRFTGLDGHEPVFAEIPHGDSITATVFEELSLGVGGQVFSESFALEPTGITVAELDLRGKSAGFGVGDLRIGIRADRETERMNLWGVTLLPIDRPKGPEGVEFEQYPRLQLKAWGAETPLQLYRKTFNGIRSGKYELVVDPINYRTEIEVVEGELTEYTLEVPTLVELRIWAVDEQGRSIQNAQQAGILYWKEVSEASLKREAEDPLYKHNKGPSEFVLDFQRGFAQAARPLDGGGWLIEAMPGIRIKMMYLGPSRGEPTPKSVVVPNGPSEDTLEIRI